MIKEMNEQEEIRKEIQSFNHDFPDCPFEILDKIGQGTFSSVYIAKDLNHHSFSNPWCANHVPKGESNSTCGKVALKRIYATSSAIRIHTELALLAHLRYLKSDGSDHVNIASLITAIRHEDQVVAVLPYFEHESFASYFKTMDRYQIKKYLFCLISALEHVHLKKFIHRDIKPSNFLYNPTLETGVLIDFGLAQKQPLTETIRYNNTRQSASKPGYMVNETRPSIRASRAGTRGFRAPEVLFKVTVQTQGYPLDSSIAIDMWSVGVTYLCILTGQFPFFQSNDDQAALMEIAHIFGKTAMREVAASFSNDRLILR